MAFDTVIDKAQLEGAITASANAIREKTGDTALIEWLQDTGFAEAIAAIEAGGGGINTGEIVVAEDCTQLAITHGFDSVPKVFFAFYDKVDSNAGNGLHLVGMTFDTSRSSNWYLYAGYSTANATYRGYSRASQNAPTSASGAGYYLFKSSNETLTLNKGDTAGFTAGQKYIWIAMG